MAATAAVPGRAGRRRRRAVAIAVTVVVVAGVTVGVTRPWRSGTTHPSSGVTDNAAATSLATVTRQDLRAQINVNATLGFAGNYSAVNQAQGIYTALPAVDQSITQGQVLYQVDGTPVVLLYGSTPAYRTLAEATSASATAGPDVAELNADLVAMGYATRSEIPAGSDGFTSSTKAAVQKLQKALGVTHNGTLTLGQAVFLPGPIRVTAASASLGTPAAPGQAVLTANSTARQVTIALDANQQSQVKTGDQVTITLPNGTSTSGAVTSVGSVATAPSSAGGTPTITIEVTPSDPAATGSLDQAPVQVSITTATATGALAVPVDALLALAQGGYAVEVVDTDGAHRLVPVTLGLFDDAAGLVQVNGSGLAAGQRVVVPAL